MAKEDMNLEDYIDLPNDSVSSSTKSKVESNDTITDVSDSLEIEESENIEFIDNPYDIVSTTVGAVTQDNVSAIADQITINSKTETEPNDKIPNNLSEVSDITRIAGEPIIHPFRGNPKDIKTEEQAELFFIKEIDRRYRFQQYETMVERLNADEKLDAIYDALEEINETTPQSSYTLQQMATLGHRYRRLLIIGAARNCVMTLISIFTSDGIDVSVEDLSMPNKLGDFTSLHSMLNEQFQEKMKELKAYDRLTIKTSTFPTGARRYGNRGGISERVSYYTNNGHRIT